MKRLSIILIVLINAVIANGQTITVNPGTSLNCGNILLSESSSGTHNFAISADNAHGLGDGGGTTTIWIDALSDFRLSTSSSGPWSQQLSFATDNNGDLASTTIYIKFTPLTKGVQIKDLPIYEEDFTCTNTKRVTGRGVAPEMEVLGNSTIISDGDNSPDTGDNTDFGTIAVGSDYTITYTIRNAAGTTTSDGDLKLTGTPKVVISGTHASDFTVTVQPSSPIARNGGTTTFDVKFAPTASGTRSASISIANNDEDENPYNFSIQGTGNTPEIDIKGNGVSITDGDETPSSSDFTDFGDVDIQIGTMSRTYYIYNTGAVNLNLTDQNSPNGIYVTIDGTHSSDFTVTLQPASPISSSSNDDFTISFNPSATGTRSAVVHVFSNDPDESEYTFAIQGTGTTPEIDIQGNSQSIANNDNTPSSADHTDFGSVDVTGTNNIIRTFTIYNLNSGSYPGLLTLSGSNPYVTISGAHAADFSIYSAPSQNITVGNSTTFMVKFDPSASGTRTATISISSNDTDESPYQFTIQGFGATTPILTTVEASAITHNSATSGGNITSDGGYTVTARGVCWNTSSNPTLSNSFTTDGSGAGLYSSPFNTLSAATQYYVRAYATNTLGTSYGSNISFYTLATEPASHPQNFSASVITSSSITLSWNAVSGAAGYIILQKSGLTAPTASGIADGHEQSDFSLPSGTIIAAEVVGSTSTVIASLPSGTDYSFTIIAYNRVSVDETYNYKTDGTLSTVSAKTLKAAPSLQATNLVFTSVSDNSMTVEWTRGNGDSCLVVVREGSVINTNPTNGVSYSYGSSLFDDGSEIGTGNFALYKGTGTSYAVTGLETGTTYFFQVFEFNNGGSNSIYQTASATNNPRSQATLKPAPTSQATNIVFSNIDSYGVTLTWERGNGDYCMVVGSLGNNISDPVNDNIYTASTTFGSGSTTGAGCYVLFKGAANTVTITGLTDRSEYYFKVIEFNNNGTSYPKYLTLTSTGNPGIVTTLGAAPTMQSSDIEFSDITSSSVNVNWTRGNGEYCILIAKESGSVANPVDNTTYTASTVFGSGSQIGTSGTFVLYIGNDANPFVSVSGLNPNRTYYFKAIEYNNHGTNFIKYYTEETSGNPNSFETENSAPSTQATSIQFSNINFTTATITWTKGNGLRRIAVVKQTNPVDTIPTDGIDYTPNTAFGSGDDMGKNNYVIYDGTGNSVSISGLTSGTTYYVQVFEYNGTDATTLYNVNTASGNPGSFATLKSTPAIQATDIVFPDVASDGMTVSWTRGNGDFCLLVAHQGSSVNDDPDDGSTYTANLNFGSGSSIGSGNYVLYRGTAATASITGLIGNTTYFFKVYEFNNNTLGTTRYLVSDATGNPASQTTANAAPTIQASNITFTSIGFDSFTVNCTKGNGQNRIIVMNTSNSFTNPENGQDPVANTDWEDNGEQVVYNGSGNTVDITSLSPSTTYWVRVYEFNNSGENTLFNTATATNNPKSQSTLKQAPDVQAYSIVFSNITSSSMTVTFTKGNGDARIVIMNTSNSFTNPSNGSSPSADNSWNNAGEQVIFNGTGNSVGVTELSSNTVYWFRVYEYNNSGSNTAYLTTTASGNPNSQSTATAATWAGGNASDPTSWHVAANWSNSAVPTSTTDVFINSSTYKPALSSNGTCNNLTISATCFLIINAGNSLTVNGNLKLETNSDVQTGQIVCKDGATISVSGNSSVEMYIKGSDYNFVSAPVSGATVNLFTGFFVKKHSEAGGFTGASLGDPMTPMKGFAIKYNTSAPNRLVTYSGTLINSNQSISVSASGTGDSDGWNLVGNPFVSSIDWKASSGWDKSSVDNTTYIHIGGGQYATYNASTNASTNGGSRYIAPMQAFFVHRSATGSATLSMDNNVRVAVARTFLKDGEQLPENMLKLRIERGDFLDETVILFYPGANNNFDFEFDAYKMFSSDNNLPEIYTSLPSGQQLSVNTYPELTETTSVPLGFKSSVAGTFRLTVIDNTFPAAYRVELEDQSVNGRVDLSTGNFYDFQSGAVMTNQRFLVHFIKGGSSVEQNIKNDIQIFSFDKTIFITDHDRNKIKQIFVYDITGRLLHLSKTDMDKTSVIQMDIAGTYIVKVISDNKINVQKVIIK